MILPAYLDCRLYQQYYATNDQMLRVNLSIRMMSPAARRMQAKTGEGECGKMRNKHLGKRMLLRNLGQDDRNPIGWEDLEKGAPTILAFAALCSRSISNDDSTEPDLEQLASQLTDESKALLVAAQSRGTMDIRASRESFDSADRFLAICVEYELDQRLLFLQKDNPEQTVRFLEGFRRLCKFGLVIHHLQKDFSLSVSGYALAKTLTRDDYSELLGFAVEIDH
ncbi:MAG: hypothetical protein AB8B55_02685 [Mariniblastus sp.]